MAIFTTIAQQLIHFINNCRDKVRRFLPVQKGFTSFNPCKEKRFKTGLPLPHPLDAKKTA